LPERSHHDRHRRHQREARDDRREAHRGLPRRAAQLRERELEPRARERGHQPESGVGDARHERDRAEQQAADRGVAEDRQPAQRRQKGKQRSGGEERETRPDPGCAAIELLLVARLERARGRRARSVERGEQRSEHGDPNAGGEIEERGQETKLELGLHPAENAGAEIGARVPHRQIGDRVPEPKAEQCTGGAERRRLGEHEARELPAGEPDHPQQSSARSGAAPPRAPAPRRPGNRR
jgi:hypothetical protein